MTSPSPLAGEGKLSRSDSRERGRRLSKLRRRAKEMLSAQTDAEQRLWLLLRAHRFGGYKFRRQVPLDFYIADFVCFAKRLIIGIWNNDLFTNEEGVAELILAALRSPPLPNPSPARGKGLNGASNG